MYLFKILNNEPKNATCKVKEHSALYIYLKEKGLRMFNFYISFFLFLISLFGGGVLHDFTETCPKKLFFWVEVSRRVEVLQASAENRRSKKHGTGGITVLHP